MDDGSRGARADDHGVVGGLGEQSRDVLQGVGAVGVGDEDVVVPGVAEAIFQCGAVAGIGLVLEEIDREGACDGAGAVARAVVDDDDFQGAHERLELADGLDGAGDGFLFIEGGNEDGHREVRGEGGGSGTGRRGQGVAAGGLKGSP